MIYNFLILSDEVENFRREINIDADATFYDLFKAIIDTTGYSDKEMASFFMCDDNWRRKQEITLVEMDSDSDIDIFVMDETPLIDFLEDEGQKLMYVFDYVNDRSLYMKLSEIITGKSIKKAKCTVSIGDAPSQMMDIIETVAPVVQTDMDEVFYGDESYNLDELDESGFEGLEGDIEEIDQIGEADL